MPNRLAGETSPYLLQHANNPVDWYPWGAEAFAKAAAEDKPIFLSVGYSACHWCHVMEHESFEDETVAKILNERFVAIKVDREERPDVDEAYMTAVQLTSGRGGWPMSVFLTPERRPFFAGTYFPKENRGSHPGFLAVCNGIAESWKNRRAEIENSAEQIADALTSSIARHAPGAAAEFTQEFVDAAIRNLLSDYDSVYGGFGGAPKFPPHSALGFLLSYAVSDGGSDDLRKGALGAAIETLRHMCLGGIHDRVGGGFHRYSTDTEWRLPHFEKMLYDNALTLRNLARAGLVCEEAAPELTQLFFSAAQGIVRWLREEATSPEGLFYCALDADSEGEEGKYYVWTEAEIQTLVPDPAFAQTFGIRKEGNFLDEATHRPTGANVLHVEPGSEEVRWDWPSEFELLRNARAERVRPGTDDKALVGWNGLTIAALAEIGYGDMAARAADRILAVEAEGKSLPRGIAKGRSFGEAFLEDYAYFIQGLLRLAAWAEDEGKSAPYRSHAVRLAGEMRRRFYDDANGGFFATGDRHEDLFGRSKPFLDQPIPSANSVALSVMLEIGDPVSAEETLRALIGWMERIPSATEALHEAALPLLGLAPIEVHLTLSESELVVDNEGIGTFEVRFSVPDGYHLNSNPAPTEWLVPTQVSVEGGEVEYPKGVDGCYVGDFALPVRVHGEGERIVKIRYQACSETECLLPKEIELNVRLLRRGA